MPGPSRNSSHRGCRRSVPVSARRRKGDHLSGAPRSTWSRSCVAKSRRARWPAVDVADTATGYEITAELPGLDEKNIEVKLSEGTLTIRGEKKEQKEETKKDYYLSERHYGSFQRSFSAPDGVDADKIEAKFKSGVLTV